MIEMQPVEWPASEEAPSSLAFQPLPPPPEGVSQWGLVP